MGKNRISVTILVAFDTLSLLSSDGDELAGCRRPSPTALSNRPVSATAERGYVRSPASCSSHQRTRTLGRRIAFSVTFGFQQARPLRVDGLFLFSFVRIHSASHLCIRERDTDLQAIDGGWLQFGSPNGFNAGALLGEADFNAVVVMPAYRVNLFGFLYSTELAEDAASVGETVGNHGFWDQRLALEWTKENIQLFGGNPDNITISGYSAGMIELL